MIMVRLVIKSTFYFIVRPTYSFSYMTSRCYIHKYIHILRHIILFEYSHQVGWQAYTHYLLKVEGLLSLSLPLYLILSHNFYFTRTRKTTTYDTSHITFTLIFHFFLLKAQGGTMVRVCQLLLFFNPLLLLIPSYITYMCIILCIFIGRYRDYSAGSYLSIVKSRYLFI